MKRYIPLAALCASALLISACVQTPTTKIEEAMTPTYSYPESPRVEQQDTYFDVQVNDPYRWLEDMDSTDVKQWVQAQNEFSKPILEAASEREPIRQRLTQLWNYERIGTPTRYGDFYFYYRNDGLQDQSVLYVTSDPQQVGKALLDPNTFSTDGTVSLARTAISPQGTYVAYGQSDGGTDWTNFYVLDVQTGEALDDFITFTKFTGLSWLPDESGFYYSRYPEGQDGTGNDLEPVSVYFHKLGTPQSQDTLVYQLENNNSHNPYVEVTRDGRFLVASISEGFFANAIHIKAKNSDTPWVQLFTDWTSRNSLIDTDGNLFFFMTNEGAETGRVIAIDINRPEPQFWQEIIPAREETLVNASYLGGKFFATYLKDAHSVVYIHDAFGRLEQELTLPSVGTIGGFTGSAEHLETYFSMTGFTEPGTVYRYNIKDDHLQAINATQTQADLSDLITEQVFYPSKDGTQVPLFIVRHKNIKYNGKNPTLLYGYGGFNVSLTPSFSPGRIAWLEAGGVYALANLRGGGEYGAAWHRAGTGLSKQNVFDDFIAAAEFLIETNITSPQHLAIQGGSNGGLLVGATITQRPELFAAAIPQVGVLDMLRYHLPSANARGWSSDYGLSENEDEFHALYAYSPVHNTKPGVCYPATLITTGDHDDRVVPWHSYKFAAALQHDQGCDNPVLLRVETRAGHGAGTPVWMSIEQIADQWAFLLEHLRLKDD